MSSPRRASQRTASIVIGRGTCPVHSRFGGCTDNTHEDAEIRQILQGGGRHITFSGDPVNPRLAQLIEDATEAGFQNIRVESCGHSIQTEEDARNLSLLGVNTWVTTLFSHSTKVHDTLSQHPGSLENTLRAMRLASQAGLAVSISIPLLPLRLQSLEKLLHLAHDVVPALAELRFYVLGDELPPPLRMSDWGETRPALAAALQLCKEWKLQTTLRTADGIPLCALAPFEEFERSLSFNPRVPIRRQSRFELAEACQSCAVRAQCPGVPATYVEQHGDQGLLPYAKRPRALYEQRTTPRRVWTDVERESARKTNYLVLRPTINCNQDCPFCSANESSNNIWEDPKVMKMQIARAARRGLKRVSFSGGEPTLSPHLKGFIEVAARCGIPYIELITNGALLARKERAQRLIDAGLTHAFVSLHGHTELLSRTMTQKVGDFDKTVAAIHHLLDGGVEIVLNHVIGTRNYRYLKSYIEFIHAEFGGRPTISFAFMTPQYKALANNHLVPRISDILPFLYPALDRAIELQQKFLIGSRQGIPPCLLGRFASWSDILDQGDAGIVEDRHQKQRSPVCDSCKYTRQCNGLWKPYVAMYGLDELRPVPGEPISDEEAARLNDYYPSGNSYPISWDEVYERLKNPNAHLLEPAARPTPDMSELVDFKPNRSRSLRVVMLGTGRQAKRLADAAHQIKNITIDAVASPHALDSMVQGFWGALVYNDAARALQEVQPDAVIIAAATHAHKELVDLALEHDLPVLVEKPLARTLEEVEALVAHKDADTKVLMAHNVLFAPGLDIARAHCERPTMVRVVKRLPANAPDSPRSWEFNNLFETLYHSIALIVWLSGAKSLELEPPTFLGDSAPERIQVMLTWPGGQAELSLDYRARLNEQRVFLEQGEARADWSRSGATFELEIDGQPTPFERDGGEHERMLRSFIAAARQDAPYPANAHDSLQVMLLTRALLDGLEQAGAPLNRPTAPKHVMSRGMQPTATAVSRRPR